MKPYLETPNPWCLPWANTKGLGFTDQRQMNIKKQLYQACLSDIEKRMDTAQKALDDAIAAGNEETKSSAGDKYETGRAMMQMEQDKYRVQLMKTVQTKNELIQIDSGIKCTKVEKGALVHTSHGIFYISVGIGKIRLSNEIYYAVSPEAPLAKAMMGGQENEVVLFQNREYRIVEIV